MEWWKQTNVAAVAVTPLISTEPLCCRMHVCTLTIFVHKEGRQGLQYILLGTACTFQLARILDQNLEF